MIAVLMALAGGVGAGLRFLVDGFIERRNRLQFPLGTLAINVTGSLLLGLLTGLAVRHGGAGGIRLVLGVGLLGGYTTFSTASIEAVRLALSDGPRQVMRAVAHATGMLVLSLLAAQVGLLAG